MFLPEKQSFVRKKIDRLEKPAVGIGVTAYLDSWKK